VSKKLKYTLITKSDFNFSYEQSESEMINTKQLPLFKKDIGVLENQLGMFETKVKDTSEIEPREMRGL